MKSTDITCGDCGKDFEAESGLATHRTWKHDDPAEKVELECEYCGTEWEVYESQVEWWPYRFCSQDCRDDWYSENWNGENHPTAGVERDFQPPYPRMSESTAGKNNPMYGLKGPKHPAWKPDSIFNPIPFGEGWEDARELALERDDGACVICGDDEFVHVHHVIPRRFVFFHPFFTLQETANDAENLVTLCPEHHGKAEHGKLSLELPEWTEDYEVY